MSVDQNAPAARLALALHIGQRVRHQDYKGRRVIGTVQGLWVDSERGLMVDCSLDAPIVIPPGDGYGEVRVQRQYAPANEFAPFDDREELIAELVAELQGALIALEAHGFTQQAGTARAVIAKAIGPITS